MSLVVRVAEFIQRQYYSLTFSIDILSRWRNNAADTVSAVEINARMVPNKKIIKIKKKKTLTTRNTRRFMNSCQNSLGASFEVGEKRARRARTRSWRVAIKSASRVNLSAAHTAFYDALCPTFIIWHFGGKREQKKPEKKLKRKERRNTATWENENGRKKQRLLRHLKDLRWLF